MNRQQRRTVSYLALVAAAMFGYAVLYKWGMGTLEGEHRSLLESLHIVVETFTTVGYGEDAAAWSAPLMQTLVIAMQLSGVALVFLALPLFVAPWLERRLEVNPPTEVDMSDHVVIFGFASRDEALIEELESGDVPYVIVEPNRDAARALSDAGNSAVHGDPESPETLDAACVESARAVVLDAGDEANATIALSVRELSSDVRVVAFLERSKFDEYLRYAGVNTVLSPRELLGRSLANKVTASITGEIGEGVDIGSDFEVVELPIQPNSPLDGTKLGESDLYERTGVTVIAIWEDGELIENPSPDRKLSPATVLLVSGSEGQIEDLKEMTGSEKRSHGHDHVIIAGYGEVGSTIREEVASAGLTATVIDVEERPGVDVVGDVTESDVLREADPEDADALILALGDDQETVFATLVAAQLDTDLEIVARANSPDSVGRLYRAGADYVLSLATVSGRMVAATVLDGETVGLDTQLEIARTPAPGLAGRSLGEADVRDRTGCTVLAVERDDYVLTDLGPEFEIQPGDSLVVTGSKSAISRFRELADVEGGATT